MLGCPRKISCRAAPSESQKPRLSCYDVARKNFGNQALRTLIGPDLAGTGDWEGISQVIAEAASVNQEAPPSMSMHLDNTKFL